MEQSHPVFTVQLTSSCFCITVPPSHLSLDVPDSVSHDRQLAASCRAGPSQPPTEVRWSLTSHDGGEVTGERVTTAGVRTSQGSETVSSLTLPQLGDNHTSLSLTCEAVYNDKIVLSKTQHIIILGILSSYFF